MKQIFLILIGALIGHTALLGQDTKPEVSPIKDLVYAQRFIFVPKSIIPQSGGSKFINSYYEMKVTKEKITCYLPYAGRAYNAAYGQIEGPLDFSITDFSYKAVPGKKQNTEITIKPNGNATDVREMQLTVYDNGSAYMHVNFNNRQPVSFNGNVDVIKEKKEK